MADFDAACKPIITGTAHLQLDDNSANPEAIAKLIKEYMNTSEEFTICDSNGFEISSSPGTTGNIKNLECKIYLEPF